MFLNPYQTTVCSTLEMSKKSIQPALQRAKIHGDLLPAELSTGTQFANIYVVPPGVTDIKPFPIPIEFDDHGTLAIAVDVRGLTRMIDGHKLKIVAGAEYDGQILRAALMRLWMVDDGAKEMRRWNDIAAKVFIRLLSESLIRRLNLGPGDQQAVQAITGMFYYCGFIDGKQILRNDSLVDEEKERIAVAVSRMTRIPVTTIMDFYAGDVPAPFDLKSYCDALRFVVNNPRLEKVDPAVVVSLMGGYWFGGDARRLMAIALEYPPIWLSMIYQSLTDRSFNSSQLTKMVEQENRNRGGESFVRDVASYLEIMTDE